MNGRVARAAYTALLRMGTPLYLARLWWRGRREPLYRQALGERLGHGSGGATAATGADGAAAAQPGRVWLHAVSLGETRAAAALIDALRAQQPALRLLLTHGTATGREAGRALLREGDVQAWLPWDTPGAVRRFLRRHRPAVGVLMETEIWPNLLFGAAATGVPMVLANARLSERSLRKAARLAAVMRPAVASLRCALAQTDDDARRLRAAGATAVRVTGNLKFDMAPDPAQVERGRRWRAAAGRAVVLAASTREGEEPPLLAAWAELKPSRPLLLLVPRHPQRFDEVAGMVSAAGLVVARRSGWGAPPGDASPGSADDLPPAAALQADVWLGDSIGEMALYYGAGQVALLGGSFAPLGGQNLIEAAACGCPVVMGPHTFNFAEAAELALAAGAAERATGIDDGVAKAVAVAADPEHDRRVARALAFAGKHRGAAARIAREVLEVAVGTGGKPYDL